MKKIRTAGNDTGIEVLPCPFCSSDNVILEKKIENGLKYYFVRCLNCGARGSVGLGGKEFAVLIWNWPMRREQVVKVND